MRRRGRGPSPLWALAVSGALAVPLGPVQVAAAAGPPEGTPAREADADPSESSQPTGSDSPELAEAKQLYQRGKAAYDTTDYNTAIQAWTEAYSSVPDSPANAPIKAALIYNLASAQQKAFGIDQDLTHLRRAEDLMESYARSIPALYGDGGEAESETAKIEERLQQVRAQIERAEADERARAEAEAAERAARQAPDGEPRDEPKPDPKARVFIITGATLLGVGVAGLGIMAGGLVLGNQADQDIPVPTQERRDQFARGRTGNTLAYVGAGVGGAFVVAGGVLLGLGLSRRRNRKVALAPGPGLASIGLSGRF